MIPALVGPLGPALRCARHQYLYDLQTGENILPTARGRARDALEAQTRVPADLRGRGTRRWVWVDPTPRPPPRRTTPSGNGVRRPGTASEAVGGTGRRTGEHPPKTLRVREGVSFELRIPMVPKPGFAWNVKVSGNVKILEEGYVPGDQPRHRVKIRAKLAGEGTVRCTFGRPVGHRARRGPHVHGPNRAWQPRARAARQSGEVGSQVHPLQGALTVTYVFAFDHRHASRP